MIYFVYTAEDRFKPSEAYKTNHDRVFGKLRDLGIPYGITYKFKETRSEDVFASGVANQIKDFYDAIEEFPNDYTVIKMRSDLWISQESVDDFVQAILDVHNNNIPNYVVGNDVQNEPLDLVWKSISASTMNTKTLYVWVTKKSGLKQKDVLYSQLRDIESYCISKKARHLKKKKPIEKILDFATRPMFTDIFKEKGCIGLGQIYLLRPNTFTTELNDHMVAYHYVTHWPKKKYTKALDQLASGLSSAS